MTAAERDRLARAVRLVLSLDGAWPSRGGWEPDDGLDRVRLAPKTRQQLLAALVGDDGREILPWPVTP